MTPGLAFINHYLANAPHMRQLFASLCPALDSAEVKKEPEFITKPKEKSHA